MNKVMEKTQSRWFWLSLLVSCIGLEAGALFYQHVLEYLPCELCIYTRVWLMAIALVCLITVFLRKNNYFRAAASLSGFILSAGLANETWNLFKVEYGVGDGGTCGFFANFPSWAPLDAWLPSMFEVQELCQATPEIVFGISMTHALILVCALFLFSFGLALIAAALDIVRGTDN